MFSPLRISIIKNAGFSLIEIIVVLVLIGILAAIPLSMYLNTVTGYTNAKINFSQVEDIQLALTRINLEIQNSSNIASITNGISYTFGSESRSIIKTVDANNVPAIMLTVTTTSGSSGSTTAMHPLVKDIDSSKTSISYDSTKKIATITIAGKFSNNASKTFILRIYNKD